jgi:hypothetical protein
MFQDSSSDKVSLLQIQDYKDNYGNEAIEK